MATSDRELAHLLGKTLETYVAWSQGTGYNTALSESGGHILLRVATGTRTVLPAPPTGWLNCFTNIYVKNTHASSPADFRISNALGDLWGANGLAAGFNAIHPALFVSDTDVTITVSGVGTPLDIQGEWHQIKKPDGWVRGFVALTTAYQDVPDVVPLSGTSRAWPVTGSGLWNGDAAPVQLQWRLIRRFTFDWNQGAGAGVPVPAYTVGAIATPIVLIPNDKLQVKVASITVPGAAVLRFYAEKLPTP